MIITLLQTIEALLRAAFSDGVAGGPAPQLNVGAVTGVQQNALPLIAIYPAAFTVDQHLSPDKLRPSHPQDQQETIDVNDSVTPGTYLLEYTPVAQSVRCQLLQPDQPPTDLAEGVDFTVDYQKATIVMDPRLRLKLTPPNRLKLNYSYIVVSTVREFQQEFLVDIFDDTPANLENWGSLVTGIILTSVDDLIEAFKPRYHTRQFMTVHTIDQLKLIEGTYGLPGAGAVLNLQLKFMVTGQLSLTQEVSSGYGLIETIAGQVQVDAGDAGNAGQSFSARG